MEDTVTLQKLIDRAVEESSKKRPRMAGDSLGLVNGSVKKVRESENKRKALNVDAQAFVASDLGKMYAHYFTILGVSDETASALVRVLITYA